jgi:beta-lactamase regulating signal transducer with metallopeptidase domain/ankyrin repeat protein
MASEALFLLLKLNLAAGAAILAVMALRTAMRNWFGARVAYALWLVVPVAVAAVLLPAREIIVDVATRAPAVVSQGAVAKAWVAAPLPVDARLDPSVLITVAWATGVLLALIVLAWRQAAFMRSLGRLRRETKGVFRSGAVATAPAIIGAVWPKLILPGDFEARFDAEEREMVLAHERVHLRRLDPTINGLAALAQCLNWFNPLIHLAAHTMRIDQELACDAAVMAKFPKARRRYAEAILKTQIAPLGLPLGCYWPVRGVHPLKQRITMLKRGLPDKRRMVAGALVAAAACLSSGCVVWVVQPISEIQASAVPPSRAQEKLNANLLSAAWRGDFSGAKASIASGADVNTRTRDGTTALVIVARAQDMRILDLLLEHGADPNLRVVGDGNALVAAAKRGHASAAAALIAHGADVNVMTPEEGTPLGAAVRTGHLEVVKHLAENGADVNLETPPPAMWNIFKTKHTPLWFAVNGDHDFIARYLRSKGGAM